MAHERRPRKLEGGRRRKKQAFLLLWRGRLTVRVRGAAVVQSNFPTPTFHSRRALAASPSLGLVIEAQDDGRPALHAAGTLRHEDACDLGSLGDLAWDGMERKRRAGTPISHWGGGAPEQRQKAGVLSQFYLAGRARVGVHA